MSQCLYLPLSKAALIIFEPATYSILAATVAAEVQLNLRCHVSSLELTYWCFDPKDRQLYCKANYANRTVSMTIKGGSGFLPQVSGPTVARHH